jgi:O-antigen/teichoic acid export membrane protein
VTYAFAMRALFGVGLHFLTPALSALDQTKVLFYFETFLAISIITAIAVAAPFGLVTLAWAQAFTTLAASVAAFIVMRRVTDVDVSGACRAFITAAILAFIYGIFLYITWTYFISTLHLAEGLLIAIGICASFVSFLPLLAVGKKLRVFTLQVFSG